MCFPNVRLVFGLASAITFAFACGEGTSPGNPVPSIVQLLPAGENRSVPSMSATILGSDFLESSIVKLDGEDRDPEFINYGRIRVTLNSSDFANDGESEIVVFNPPPGGGLSNSLTLIMDESVAGVPYISSISPDHGFVGDTGVEITIEGDWFAESSFVHIEFSGDRDVIFVSATELRLVLDTSDLVRERTWVFEVINPRSGQLPIGGGWSNRVEFQVRTP